MEKKPWERLEEESSKSYHAFQVYLNFGEERSLRKVAEKEGQNGGKKRVKIYEKLSSKYKWVERAKAYDDYVLGKIRDKIEKKRIKSKIDRIKKIDLIKKRVFREILKQPPEGTFRELFKIFQDALYEERTEFKEPSIIKESTSTTTTVKQEKSDINTNISGSINLQDLSMEELRRIADEDESE